MSMPRQSDGRQWRGAVGVLFAIASCLFSVGCMGSWAIRGTRLHYNESYSHTSSQELLLNLVRMRYGETPTFLDLPSITNVTEASVGGDGGQELDDVTQGVFGGTFGLKDEPTLGYQPRRGDNLSESLVKQMTAELLLDIPPGNDTRMFLLAFVDSINGVRNSPTATSPLSRILEPNDDYKTAVDLFMGLQDRGAIKFRVAMRDDQVHGPVPKTSPLAGDAIEAAKEGFVYRSADEQVTLLERARLLALTIKPEELAMADVTELTRAFRLEPGLPVYAVKSQENVEIDLNGEAAGSAPPVTPADTIAMNVRSGYQVMAFLSKGIDVPPAHVRHGSVHLFKGPDGRPFDARCLTKGLFHVCVQKHRPFRSDLAVRHRGHWFYIAENDVQSRATLNFVKLVLDLNSQSGSAGPVLTLPLR
jgi:hypothetical protein